MTFILNSQRNEDVARAFENYKIYLNKNKEIFPPSAYRLASSDWYFDPSDHRCPHDAWLQEFVMSEFSTGKRHEIRHTSIKLRLLSAYQDGFIELYYPNVFQYRFEGQFVQSGHGDWRYDEFRLSGDNKLHHEIEWTTSRETSHWLIESDDVHFSWFHVEESCQD